MKSLLEKLESILSHIRSITFSFLHDVLKKITAKHPRSFFSVKLHASVYISVIQSSSGDVGHNFTEVLFALGVACSNVSEE